MSLDPLLHGTKISAARDILGTVSDTNLEAWQLEIARNGSDDYALLASGSGVVDNGVLLLQLDPARFETGFYTLRLTATDEAGRVGQGIARRVANRLVWIEGAVISVLAKIDEFSREARMQLGVVDHRLENTGSRKHLGQMKLHLCKASFHLEACIPCASVSTVEAVRFAGLRIGEGSINEAGVRNAINQFV